MLDKKAVEEKERQDPDNSPQMRPGQSMQFAEKIKKKSDYVLALKRNQNSLKRQEYFSDEEFKRIRVITKTQGKSTREIRSIIRQRI